MDNTTNEMAVPKYVQDKKKDTADLVESWLEELPCYSVGDQAPQFTCDHAYSVTYQEHDTFKAELIDKEHNIYTLHDPKHTVKVFEKEILPTDEFYDYIFDKVAWSQRVKPMLRFSEKYIIEHFLYNINLLLSCVVFPEDSEERPAKKKRVVHWRMPPRYKVDYEVSLLPSHSQSPYKYCVDKKVVRVDGLCTSNPETEKYNITSMAVTFRVEGTNDHQKPLTSRKEKNVVWHIPITMVIRVPKNDTNREGVSMNTYFSPI
jgi:hypothetical protein